MCIPHMGLWRINEYVWMHLAEYLVHDVLLISVSSLPVSLSNNQRFSVQVSRVCAGIYLVVTNFGGISGIE